ncbi:lysylphosphatidylglycerol synthase transmembrane domain-containing protein [Phytoactinopolyspora halotolerans]|uniref:Flippase-like domain-containing protein n=1 Tax=Phytoactinopolyspora halotolerans TaxID=1981512 RepID=A0A6L9SGK6_9ACTN|nr:lysylphosphatidylglycerol synthase transmembrane domain-containing protein [Phytoactinopolyspora halotolerans]NEE03240.1 hypothetical protein [Phytoactinopolyspora halotolerans]
MTRPMDLPRRAGDSVVIDEPPLPARTRRPIDALWLLLVTAAMTTLVVLSIVAERTLTAATADLADFNDRLPDGPVEIVAFAANLAGFVLPPVLIVVLMLRGRARIVVELVIAGAAAAVCTVLVSAWLTGPAPARLHDSLVPIVDGAEGTPVPTYQALLVTLVTVVSRLDVRRFRQVAIFAIAGDLAVSLLRGHATVGGLLIAIGIGAAAGLVARLVGGQPSVAPSGQKIAAVLAAHGYDIIALLHRPEDEQRRFTAQTPDDTFTVLVLDRDNEGAGTVARAFGRLRTHQEVLPRQSVTMRDAINRLTLQSLAVARAGARTPEIRSVLRIDRESAAIVYDYVAGTYLADLAADDVSDALLEDLWLQVAQLQRNHVAHRRLSGRTIMISDAGEPWLLDPSGGEVAATDVALRADIVQVLVAVADVVGPVRAVDSAIDTLGAAIVGETVPFIQPAALPRATRHELKQDRNILRDLRDHLVERLGTAAAPVQLRRFRPLSMLTGVGTVVAVYLVGTQLTDVSFGDLWAETDLRWLVVAVAMMLGNYVGMALGILGFVPERIPFRHAFGAQVALGFVRLLAPAAVSNMAVNIRLLTRAELAGPMATASVAAHQAGQWAVVFPLFAILAVISGSSATAQLASETTLIILVGALAAGVIVALIPRVRRWARTLWSDFTGQGLPRLLDVLSDPRKLATAVGGILLQSFSMIVCFYACLKAVGGSAPIAGMAVVQLVGNTLGTAVPTPGGLGAVEAALSAGVGTLGVEAATAVTAVLLFRLVTFWLPILPGWVAWTQMQRRGLL